MDWTFLTFSTAAVSASPTRAVKFLRSLQAVKTEEGPRGHAECHDGLLLQAGKVGVNCERIRFSELDDLVCRAALIYVRSEGGEKGVTQR